MKSLLFDLEGTLVKNIYQDDPNMVNILNIKTKKFLIEQGIPKDILLDLDRSAILRNKSYEWIKTIDTSNKEYDKLYNKIEVLLKPFDHKAIKSSRIYEDTKYVLDILKKSSFKLGIVTNTSQDAAETILSKHSLRNYFSTVITRNHVCYVKPNPEMIELATVKLKSEPLFLIGDSSLDAEAAKNANVKSIIIRREDDSLNVFHNYKLKSLKEIINIIYSRAREAPPENIDTIK